MQKSSSLVFWEHRSGVAVLCGALLLVACGEATRPLDWTLVDELISEHFPDVPSLTTTELAALLSAGSREVVLLDARERDEFDVSHLEGAHHAPSESDAVALLQSSTPGALIVVYCSVGYRSAALVERLHARQFANVVNLQGSIFAWASEGRPLYRGDSPVEHVHPYDRRWGALLPRVLWSCGPDLAVP